MEHDETTEKGLRAMGNIHRTRATMYLGMFESKFPDREFHLLNAAKLCIHLGEDLGTDMTLQKEKYDTLLNAYESCAECCA